MEYNNINDLNKMQGLLNLRQHAEILLIPVLKDFNVIDSANPQSILIARSTDNAFLEQVIADGPLMDGETFEDRIQLVIDRLQLFLQNDPNNCEESNCFYYKDYQTKDFEYKIYVQDFVIKREDGQKLITRMANAFFVEPRFNDFYQISLAVGPFNFSTDVLKLGEVDCENDAISNALMTMFEIILDLTKYRDE